MDKDRIEGSAKDLAGKSEAAVGNVAGNAKTEAAGRAREAVGTMQNLYGQAKDAAREAAGAASNVVNDIYDNDKLRDGRQALAQKVHENPLGALLVAGAVGFALALLMSSPPRRRQEPRWRRYYG